MQRGILILVLTWTAFTCASCKKGGLGDAPTAYLSWTLDGGPVQESTKTGLLNLFGTYILSAEKGTTFLFVSTNSPNTGIYTMANANAGFGLKINGTDYSPITGIMHISSNTNRLLAGTFSSQMMVANVDTIFLSANFNNVRY